MAVETKHVSQTFWQKHWRWLGLILVVGPVLVLTLTCASFIWSLWQLKGSLPAYQMTLEAVSNNPRVIETLGEPIVFDEMITGSVQVDDDTGIGFAQLNLGAAGPKGEGYIESHIDYAQDEWALKKLTVTIKDGEVITIVE